jgi:ATP phosphoribosyltransferase regulatory subunit
LKRVREEMGLKNVQVMVPFVRTLKEAEQVTQLLAQNGLKRGENDLKVIMMCELPTNALLADRYLEQQALDAAHVPAATLKLLRDYLSISGPAMQALTRIEALAHARRLDLAAPLATLRRHLATLGPEADITFEAAFSPRLDYYTGIVFEMTGRVGEVLASGGQYDRLLERLGATMPVAASGCSLWVDRLEAEAQR